jgi:hypothetical protein
MSTADLDAMGIPSGQIRTDLVEFRQVLEDMVALWENNAVTPQNNPEQTVDKIRRMLIV